MKYKPNSDLNHAWGAAPANIIPGFLWGIEPAEPGYAKARIKPQPGSLKNSRVVVPSIRGNIEASFNREGNIVYYQVMLPGNMECDMILNGDLTVYLNNRQVKLANGVLKLSSGFSNIKVINNSISQ